MTSVDMPQGKAHEIGRLARGAELRFPSKPRTDPTGIVAHQTTQSLGFSDESVSLERMSLRLPSDLSLERWCQIGGQILTVSDSSAWWIGDWLVFGQDRYPDRYKRAMRDTALDNQTLRNYAWVARKFPASRRRDELTLQHHMEVAALPPDEQGHWLDLACRFKWSRNELRRQVRNSGAGSGSDEDGHEVKLNLSLDESRLRRWKAAARTKNQELVDWISSVLDGAA